MTTPPYPLLLSRMPEEALAPLAEALAGRERRLSGVNAAAECGPGVRGRVGSDGPR